MKSKIINIVILIVAITSLCGCESFVPKEKKRLAMYILQQIQYLQLVGVLVL